MKTCPKCSKRKSLTEYWKNKSTSDGYQAWCKPCWYAKTKEKLDGKDRQKYLRMRRNGHLMRKYGITADQYDAMFKKQGKKCLICEKKSERVALAVDHDPITGKIRGILCENCNRGIGMFRHEVKLLNNAIKYLNTTAIAD